MYTLKTARVEITLEWFHMHDLLAELTGSYITGLDLLSANDVIFEINGHTLVLTNALQ